MSTNTAIVGQLRRFAKVLVYVGERESVTTQSISVSPVKLDELVSMYDKIYAFTTLSLTASTAHRSARWRS